MSDSKKLNATAGPLTYDDVRSVSPALEQYTREALLGGLWKRPELSPRDRSIVTVAAVIARIQTIEMQERAPGGTLTRPARRSSSRRVLAGCSEMVVPLKK